MNIGASIFLIAVGAILSFAVNASVRSVELDVVGYILMAAGAIGLLLSLMTTRRRAVPREEVVVQEVPERRL